jgi:hypothetical protein
LGCETLGRGEMDTILEPVVVVEVMLIKISGMRTGRGRWITCDSRVPM